MICITSRKLSVAASYNASRATIWKIELYKGSVFQSLFQFLVFLVSTVIGMRFAYRRLCRFFPSDNIVGMRHATSLHFNILNTIHLPITF